MQLSPHRLFGLVYVLGMLLSGCQPATTPSTPQLDPSSVSDPNPIPIPDQPGDFRDVTDQSGISFEYRNGEEKDHFAILESLGGGGGVIDYDQDGLLDLIFPGGGDFVGPDRRTIVGLPGRIYRNLGNFRFQDVTDDVGFGPSPMYSHGIAVADYNRDGWPDFLMTGYGRVVLYQNVPDANGKRRFQDVTTAAKLDGDRSWSSSAAFGDLDGDGWPDLYICHYVNWSWENNPKCPGYSTQYPQDVCAPKVYGSIPHQLFRNNGDGTFTDVSAAAGIRVKRDDAEYGKGLGVLIADLNGDSKPEIYVGNDTTDNFLYINRSELGTIRLEENGFALGVARDANGVPNGSMGIDAADYDGSNRPSIWVTNYENEFHALYRNLTPPGGRMLFSYGTPLAGLGAMGPIYVGFGTGFIDYDNDGWEDLLIANGHVVRYPARNNLRQPPVLFQNQQVGKYRKYINRVDQAGAAFRKPIRGRGLALADLDNDGWIDAVFPRLNEPVLMLRNEGLNRPTHHWLGMELIGSERRDVVGATITVEVAGQTRKRYAKGGASYLSSNDRRIVLGLGAASEPVNVTVDWPSGEPRRQVFTGLAPDRYHRLQQGK
ncbi:CRTAC1 family protein [Tuwongella immobilis]|uniref:ASPIC/UnbV domain-containing protein n=1 Tax=Tuwongella immobilis TaxID=692036 RepID=A0A6C2YPN2_9BACT|nr:CRTAC1 family protein [Tuwongella immobilis]VIP03580.1 Uncharacterized protein OS=Planctomyces maris DSM 8797 GN=PM8797T_22088 PE=4 SV=1: VCBS: VCBS: VCBS: UnbV_ASPIC [Tuwongella immobilis]VTS04528.1 Uncharacterized protein OS=Planctomyces maris DSM 8797 GN=PM8797T_22088 PE=4 SV=1: VCBS: VCBS: VCBS: UnbV_ASPIC [Tuwongella immobilis]